MPSEIRPILRKARRGLYLDFDGTLADSLQAMRNVYDRFLNSRGLQPTDAEFNLLNGPPLDRVIQMLKDRHELRDTPADLSAQYRHEISQEYSAVAPSAGSEELLQFARENGWAVAVVTSSDREFVHAWLDRHGFSPLVADIIGGTDVMLGKPAPDPYLLALSRTNCDAALSWAVEDSLAGAQASEAAGLKIAVLRKAPDGASDWPHGVHFIDRISDMVPRLAQTDC